MRRVIIRGDGAHAMVDVMQALNKCKPVNVVHIVKSSEMAKMLQSYFMLGMIGVDTIRGDVQYDAAIVIDQPDYDKDEVAPGGAIHLVGRSKR